MPTIHLTTFIAAPVERVFDLSRSVSLHKVSMEKMGGKAVSGIISGLINKDESVTWKAKYFFKTRFFTFKVTAMEPYKMFIDQMVRSDFKYFQHEHYFKHADNGTIIIDIINFEPPYGWFGKVVNRLYLNGQLEKMVVNHNEVIRQYAVSDKWRALLHNR